MLTHVRNVINPLASGTGGVVVTMTDVVLAMITCMDGWI